MRILAGRGGQRVAGAHNVQDLVGRHDVLTVPRVRRADRHLLDDAQLDAPVQAVVDQVRQVGLVHAAQDEGVDLDGAQARAGGGLDALQDVAEAIAARDRREVLGVQRIKRNVDAIQARVLQALGALGQAERVRREGQVQGVSLVGAQVGARFDDPLEASAQEGFPTREADLADPEPLDADAHEAHDLVVRQGFLGGQPVQAFGGHAVGTAQVAAVGERDTQVSGHTPEGVDEPQRRVTRHRICPLRGGNELDRHGATLPRFALCSPLEKQARTA